MEIFEIFPKIFFNFFSKFPNFFHIHKNHKIHKYLQNSEIYEKSKKLLKIQIKKSKNWTKIHNFKDGTNSPKWTKIQE